MNFQFLINKTRITKELYYLHFYNNKKKKLLDIFSIKYKYNFLSIIELILI